MFRLFTFFVFLFLPLVGITDTLPDKKENTKELDYIKKQYEYIVANIRSAPEEIKPIAEKLLIETEKQGHKYSQTIVLNALCRIDYLLGNLVEALDYGFLALERCKELPLNSQLHFSAIYNNMASIYLEIGDQTEALKYYLMALEWFHNNPDARNEGVLLGNIGNLYLNIGQNSKAIEYFEKALFLFEPLAYTKGMAINNNNLGEVYFTLKDFDNALTRYEKAFELYQSLNDKRGIALVLNNIGNLYQNQGKANKALPYLKKSLAQQKQLGLAIGMAETMSNLGALYILLGDTDSSAYYLKKSQEIAKSRGSVSLLQLNAKNMSNLFAAKNKMSKALDWYKLYKQYSDSTILANRDYLLAEMQTKYETKQKEKEINLLKQEKEIRSLEQEKSKQLRNFVIFSLLLIIIIIYTVFLIRNSRIAKKMGELERIALRAQMKPHFIFNALSSIQTFILENDLRNADRYLSKFARLIRIILESSKMPLVLLESELDMLKLYIEIEKMRLDNKFESKIKIDPEINPRQIKIASMLMQPFVENAIWHGLSPKEGSGILKIDIRTSGSNLLCTITDDGVGRQRANEERNKLPGHKSMGLKITENRLDLIHRKMFTKKQYFKIDDLFENGNAVGTKVVIKIPFEKN
jgi:tetratricopeptide (TPR) repeat protein